MGLCIEAKGLDKNYDCGYLTHGVFLRKLAEAYDPELGALFDTACLRELNEEENARWDEICDDGLDLLLFHSDCDGKLTPRECRKVYNAIKDLKMDMLGHNYGDMKQYNLLERWKYMLKHCANRRVNLYFR